VLPEPSPNGPPRPCPLLYRRPAGRHLTTWNNPETATIGSLAEPGEGQAGTSRRSLHPSVGNKTTPPPSLSYGPRTAGSAGSRCPRAGNGTLHTSGGVSSKQQRRHHRHRRGAAVNGSVAGPDDRQCREPSAGVGSLGGATLVQQRRACGARPGGAHRRDPPPRRPRFTLHGWRRSSTSRSDAHLPRSTPASTTS
jgi:hypothetical protein